jgi:N-acetylglucosamine repressor
MYSGTDLYSIAENSHKQVLNIIRIHKEISGAEIARLSGFQPSTILYILRILDKRGFINISRTGDSTQKGGKKPVLWKIKPGIGLMLGIEVMSDKLRFVKIDFAGNLYDRGEKSMSAPVTMENAASLINNAIRDILHEAELFSRSFLGIGMGIPGLIDSQKGIVQYSTLLQLKNLNLGEQLKYLLGKPVYIVNDANAGALGISLYHNQVQEKLPEDIVYLNYNKGSKNLGSGLIVKHELYEGIAGTAGELCDPMPDIELLVNTAIKKYGRNHPLLSDKNNLKTVSFKKIVDYALAGCKISTYVVDKICNLVCKEITRLTGLLNPNLIVLGGDITCHEELLTSYILPGTKKMTREMLKMGFVLPLICFSNYGEFSVSMGATAMILSKILRNKNHKIR